MGIIKDASLILHTDAKLVSIAKKRVVVGHRRPKNLKDYLVKSRLQYPPPPRLLNQQPLVSIQPKSVTTKIADTVQNWTTVALLPALQPRKPTLYHKGSHADSTI